MDAETPLLNAHAAVVPVKHQCDQHVVKRSTPGHADRLQRVTELYS